MIPQTALETIAGELKFAPRRRIMIVSGSEALIELRRFLNAGEPKVQRGAIALWKAQAGMISGTDVEEMLRSAQPPAKLTKAWEAANADFVEEKIVALYLQAFEETEKNTASRLRRILGKAGLPTSAAVQKWVTAHSGELITRLNTDMHGVINSILREHVIRQPMSPFQLSKLIRPHIGLTERWSLAVSRRYRALVDSGVSIESALAESERYATFLHKVRGMMIGRQELAMAYGEGQWQALVDAQVAGTITDRVVKTWATADDERTCFPRSTKIITSRGKRKIEQIKVGDIVLTHRGWRKVLKTMARPYSGLMIKIKLLGGKKLMATFRHPIYEQSKGWIEIKDIKLGDHLKRADNQLGKVVAFQYFRAFNSDNFISKIRNFSISFNVFDWVRMPIWAVNFKAYVFSGYEKINSIFLNSKFLDEFNPKRHQRIFNENFKARFFSFSKIFSKTRERTKSTAVGGRLFSKLFSTMSTFYKNRRSSTNLGTINPIMARFMVGKNASATRAYFSNNKFMATFQTANGISIGYGFINQKSLIAYGADFLNFIRSRYLITFSRTIDSIAKRFIEIKSFMANRADFIFTRARGIMITLRRTESRTIRFCRRPFRNKFFSTIFTYMSHINRYLINKIIGCQPYIVYNLEIEDAHTYFANGNLVHNCDECADLDGEQQELNEPFSAGVMHNPLHVQCRCANQHEIIRGS